jgi:hypothetical protein
MMSAACRSARAIRSRGLTFRSSSTTSEQLAQRRQVQNSRLAAGVRYPSGSRRLGRAARLVSDAANDDVGKARSLGQPDVLANVRAGRHITGSTWLRILRHADHPAPAGWSA